MERIQTKNAGAAGDDELAVGSEQAGDFLSEVVLDNIDKLMYEDSRSPSAPSVQISPREDNHCAFRQALRELLAEPSIRTVLELHFGTWLKDDPVKRWLWECSQALDRPEMLEDSSYLDELETLLAQVTAMADEAQENPELMRALLRRLLTTPWQFTAPEG